MLNLLKNVITTMDTIPVEGIENMRKMVSCTDQLVQLHNIIAAISQAPENPAEEKKKEGANG